MVSIDCVLFSAFLLGAEAAGQWQCGCRSPAATSPDTALAVPQPVHPPCRGKHQHGQPPLSSWKLNVLLSSLRVPGGSELRPSGSSVSALLLSSCGLHRAVEHLQSPPVRLRCAGRAEPRVSCGQAVLGHVLVGV